MNMTDLENWLQRQPHKYKSSSPSLFILMGLSGSGKSTVSQFLVRQYNAVWVSSDIERQQQYAGRDDMYSPAVTRSLFEYIASLTNQLLRAGYPVVIDSCALKQEERDQFRLVADNNHCPEVLIYCQAPEEILKERVKLRLQANKDPSQAQPELIDFQQKWLEPPSTREKPSLIDINTNQNEWQVVLSAELDRRL